MVLSVPPAFILKPWSNSQV